MRRFLFIAVFLLVGPTPIAFASLASAQSPGVTGTPAAGTTQATLGGNAVSLLKDVDTDGVDVIAFGPMDHGHIPVIVRNNSSKSIHDVEVKVEARDSEGTLVGVGGSRQGHGMKPYRLNPGDFALGFAYISGDIDPASEFEFSVTSSTDTETRAEFFVDVEFLEVEWLQDRVIGEFVNSSDDTLGETYLMIACISEDGIPLLSDVDYIGETVAPQGLTTFQMNGVFGDLSLCEHFLIAGTGHPEI